MNTRGQLADRRVWVSRCANLGFRSLLTILLACWALGGGSASGLDLSRTLTQSLQRIWQVQSGLPRATILKILQTHDGYLWLGTQEGLTRFDGVRFADPLGFAGAQSAAGGSAERPWVIDLVEDAEHRLWIATENQGLLCFDGQKTNSVPAASGQSSNSVSCLLYDRQRRLVGRRIGRPFALRR